MNADLLCFHENLPFSQGTGEDVMRCALETPKSPGVLDLETGAGAGLGAFNDYYVPTGEAGLFPAAGEILLSGVRSGGGGATLQQFYKSGENRIITKTFDACEEYAKAGALVGHNLLGFDLPFLATRARVQGIPVPEWVLSGNGTIDTYKMFVTRGKFFTGMLSLQECGALWGRTPDGESGASFGDLWRNGTEEQRNDLKHYNMLNLIDCLALAVHSGKVGLPKGAVATPFIKNKPWKGSDGYNFAAPSAKQTMAECNFFQWLTAPVEGLLENGPRKISGWGRTNDKDARQDYPKGSGRIDAGGSRIVGFVSSKSRLLNIEDEVFVINQGLREILSLGEAGGPIFTEAPNQAKNFLCLRSSIYGGILPEWIGTEGQLTEDRIKELGDGFLKGISKSEGGVDFRIPVYTGENPDHFLEAAYRIGAKRANKANEIVGLSKLE